MIYRWFKGYNRLLVNTFSNFISVTVGGVGEWKPSVLHSRLMLRLTVSETRQPTIDLAVPTGGTCKAQRRAVKVTG